MEQSFYAYEIPVSSGDVHNWVMENNLKGKHIILGITGSIAAYKAAYIIRALVKKDRKSVV